MELENFDKLEAKAQVKHTKRATLWEIKNFEKWCDELNLNDDLNCVILVLNELVRMNGSK